MTHLGRYVSRYDFTSRRAEEFEVGAEHAAFRRAVRSAVRDRGWNPDLLPSMAEDQYATPIISRDELRHIMPPDDVEEILSRASDIKKAISGSLADVASHAIPALGVFNKGRNIARLQEIEPKLDQFVTQDDLELLTYVSPEELDRYIREQVPEGYSGGRISGFNFGPLIEDTRAKLGGYPSGEPPFPGVAGKVPGFRTPAELAATIGTAGIGTTGTLLRRGLQAGIGTAAGSIGAMAGGDAAEQVGAPQYVGELVGGLAGGAYGYSRFRPPRPRVELAESPKSIVDTGPVQEPDLPPINFDLGDTAAREMLRVKEEALLKPGRVTQLPIVRRGARFINPAVDLDRNILTSYNARGATRSMLDTHFWSLRRKPWDTLRREWDLHKPRYIGPEHNPIQGTIKDWADNPDFYEAAAPPLRAAARQFDRTSDRILAEVRNKWGVDIGVYRSGKKDSFYLPTAASKLSREKMVEAASGAPFTEVLDDTAVRLTKGRAKTRIYESGYNRWLRDKNFIPETDVEALITAHDSSLAHAAGNNVFRMGSPGKSKIEVIDELRPGLRETRDATAARLQSIRARVQTATSQVKRLGATERKLESLRTQAEKRVDPTLDRIFELGDDFGPELSHLSGEAHQLDREITAIDKALRGVRARKGEIDLPALKQEMRLVKDELDKLRNAYTNTSIEPYNLSRKTNLYYLPDELDAVENILKTDIGAFDGLANVVDEIRMTAFAGDASPMTIQAFLGAAADPVTAVKNAGSVVRQVARGTSIRELADAEPELVARFTTATDRRFGEVGPEIHLGGRGLERVPRLGKVFRRLIEGVEVLRYHQWKNDTELLQKWGHPVAIADHEAANTLSKVIPALNPAERGVSVARAKVERIPVISPSFLASPALLMKDAASGMFKLATARTLSPRIAWQAASGREQLAMLRLVNMAGSAFTLSVASALLSAKSRDWTVGDAVAAVTDPDSPYFLSIVTGSSGSIGIGGPYRSFIRGIAPRYEDGEFTPFYNTLQFVRGKAVPPLSVSIDMIRNEDFRREPVVKGDFPTNILTGLWYATESFSPLSAGALSEKVRTGEANPRSLVTAAASQFAGANYRETTPYESLLLRRDRIAQETYDRDWDDLTNSERFKLEKDHPEELVRPEPRTERGKALAARREIGARFEELQKQVDQQFGPGPDWIEAYKNLKDQQSGAYQQWEADYPEVHGWLQTLEPEDSNEQALAEYRKAFQTSRTSWGELDPELLGQVLNRLEREWTPEQKKFIEQETGLRDTPTVRAYKAAQDTLRPYWEIEDQVWEQIRRRPEFARYASLDEFVRSSSEELLLMGVPEQELYYRLNQIPLLGRISQVVSELRYQYRLRHPDVDRLLVEWYGNTPIRIQESGGRGVRSAVAR